MTPARTPPSADRPRLGLRERKKIRTRTAIRDATYALIGEQGYDATTIEQIAERAEVSPSTVLRYFPAKEDIVLTDEYDDAILRELHGRPADEPWTDSLRYALRKAAARATAEEPGITRLRWRLVAEVPAVRSRMAQSMSVTGRLLGQALAERTGRAPDGLEVRVLTTALMGGLMEAFLYWAEHGHRENLQDLVDRALTVIEQGPGRGNP
ncbi:TetR family transcriptional regulator [Streptomyces sp. NPDC052701]|uniref:TetR/AcrR family transcriptional regulator n=1 Tax=Streptomyces sp. NPDC052701 TaxID=3155533 RepID=UPI00343B29C9